MSTVYIRKVKDNSREIDIDDLNEESLQVFDEAINEGMLDKIDSMSTVYIRKVKDDSEEIIRNRLIENNVNKSTEKFKHLKAFKDCYDSLTKDIQKDKDGHVQNVFIRMKKEDFDKDEKRMVIEIGLLKNELTKLVKKRGTVNHASSIIDDQRWKKIPFLTNSGLEGFLKPDYSITKMKRTGYNRNKQSNRYATTDMLPWMVSSNFTKKFQELKNVPSESKQTKQEKDRLVSNVFIFKIIRERIFTEKSETSNISRRDQENEPMKKSYCLKVTMPISVNKKYRSLSYLNDFCGIESSDFKDREIEVNKKSSKLYRFSERILYNPEVEYKAEKERVKKDINRPPELDIDSAERSIVWTISEGLLKIGLSFLFCLVVFGCCMVNKFSMLLLTHQTPFKETESTFSETESTSNETESTSSPLLPMAICLLSVEVVNFIPVALRYFLSSGLLNIFLASDDYKEEFNRIFSRSEWKFWLREGLDVVAQVVYVLFVLPRISITNAVFFSSLMFAMPLLLRFKIKSSEFNQIPKFVYILFGLVQVGAIAVFTFFTVVEKDGLKPTPTPTPTPTLTPTPTPSGLKIESLKNYYGVVGAFCLLFMQLRPFDNFSKSRVDNQTKEEAHLQNKDEVYVQQEADKKYKRMRSLRDHVNFYVNLYRTIAVAILTTVRSSILDKF